MYFIAVEGLIGVGKSSLSKQLAIALNAREFKEPVETNPFLELFYEDPKKYALSMQYYLLCERFSMHKEGIKHLWGTRQPVIFDRSIFGDACFCEVNYLLNNMTFSDYMVYQKMKDLILKEHLLIPHFTIYLDVDPEVALMNIKNRGRECEEGITLEYLQMLKRSYDDEMLKLEQLGTNLIRINWNEFGTVETIIKRMGI